MEFLLYVFGFDDKLSICYACWGDMTSSPFTMHAAGSGDDEFPICNVSF